MIKDNAMVNHKAPLMISPSILAGNLARMERELHLLSEAGADLLHIDVMDGHFVPNLTFGAKFTKDIKSITQIPLDVHLMVTDPAAWLDEYLDLSPYALTFHYEATHLPVRLLNRIRGRGVRAGIAINPSTPVEMLRPLVPLLDLILIMTVEPGFYGQSYLPHIGQKVAECSEKFHPLNENLIISVDGGINDENACYLRQSGAQILVAGGFLFKGESYKENMIRLKRSTE